MARASLEEILEVRRHSSVVFSRESVDRAVDDIAASLTEQIGNANPLVLCVMKGGVPFTADLLRRFDFPLELDYLHVSRYHDRTRGSHLEWHRVPQTRVEGRTLLIVDDVLDEGETLAALVAWSHEQSARRTLSAVLVAKDIPRDIDVRVDFTALNAPNRYLYGRGMDYKGYWRNLPDIYAVDPEFLAE
ncbi:MAG: hypoxanthine-guanine phosphoribosyltransferase [Gammaproteobacteria bacterium]